MAKSTVVKEGKLFIETVMAKLTGDKDKAIASRNARLAISATKGQISALEGELVKSEIDAENKKEMLDNAKYPTVSITDSEQYIKNIVNKQESFDAALEKLEDIKESIKYFEDQLKEFIA
tara:strand:+ start:546 stop:905 length:360 start_codon:yes stop_codon:yes gene_type:complete